jgi:hypothetical protein
MYIRLSTAVGFLLVITTVQAQDLPLASNALKTNDPPVSDTIVIREQGQFSLGNPISNAMLPSPNAQPMPDKPQPLAREGQWIVEGEQMPKFSDDLVMVARKDDGNMRWYVQKVNSCAWCGTPLTWKQAAFDRKAASMWILRSALVVADVEITHHLPCFEAGTCKEWNPMMGQTRLQGYSVGAGLTAIAWAGDAWLRKGSREDRIGGYRRWWIIPTVGYAASAVGIVANLARWRSR